MRKKRAKMLRRLALTGIAHGLADAKDFKKTYRAIKRSWNSSPVFRKLVANAK